MWGNPIGWKPVEWAVKEFTQGRTKKTEFTEYTPRKGQAGQQRECL